MSRLRELAEQEWEPIQHYHASSCGMQGSHSLGAGQRGSCTCGMDALIQQRNDLAVLLADAKDALECRLYAGHMPLGTPCNYPEEPMCDRCALLARIEELEGRA